MADTPKESVTIATDLGPAVIQMPAGWKGEALSGNAFGEWVFDDPGDRYSLYIKTEREPPDDDDNVGRKIATTAYCTEIAHRAL